VNPPAVSLKGIVKKYPRVVANDGVELSVRRGSIHAVVGENGAGKSTLMKILYGMVRPDAGAVEMDGKPVAFSGPQDAIAAGIGMVHQHFMLVPPMTVYENVVLGAEPPGAGLNGALGIWDRRAARDAVVRLSKEYAVAVDPDAKLRTLSVGEEQRVEILKVLYRGARILILDEPTAVLTPQEADGLFDTLRRLRDAGATILFISHKLKEVLALCDTVTVLRRGKTVGTWPTAEVTLESLAQKMVGDQEVRSPESSRYTFSGPAEKVLRLDKVSVLGLRGETALKHVSLAVHAGEVLGVAGVEGNGQKELAEAASGLVEPSSGTVARFGRVGYVPEDRHRAGLMLTAEARENAILGRHFEPEFSRPWRLDKDAIDRHTRKIAEDYDLQPREIAQRAGAFSGGNQQKIVVGREISKKPLLLVVAHPTRGVDLAAARLIHEKILQAKAGGAGVLLITSDLDELLALSDRIVALFAGKVSGECLRADATIEKLGQWMMGIHD